MVASSWSPRVVSSGTTPTLCLGDLESQEVSKKFYKILKSEAYAHPACSEVNTRGAIQGEDGLHHSGAGTACCERVLAVRLGSISPC